MRILAAFVLSVIGFLPVAEGVASVTRAPDLPACCRAHGKHQCAMRSASETAPALYAVCDKYSWPALSSTVADTRAFQPKSSAAFFEPLVSRRVAPAQAESLRNISFERGRHKRGPPTFSS